MNNYNVISLGAGVQSSTLALMAEVGEISPKPDAAIFADTQAEPKSVYRWLDWLESQLSFPVYRVTKGDLAEAGLELRTSKRSGKVYLNTLIPLFLAGETEGILWRKCTRDFKVDVILKKIKELYAGSLGTQWIGISTDEAHRMKDSPVEWLENRYPLIDLGMSRADCLNWMKDQGYPEPPRSACYFCPYHSDREWVRLKTEEPEEFQKAVEWERRCQVAASENEVLRGIPYLHASRIPLEQVDFGRWRSQAKELKGQENMFGNECEGMCGV
jgi:hypothetical protein